MARAICPGTGAPEHYVLIDDDKIKVGRRGQCSRYGHRWVIVMKNPLQLKSND